MPRSRTRVGDLNKVFKNGDSDLLNHVGAMCILFEDFKIEFESLQAFAPVTSDIMEPSQLHKVLYFVRRSLVTMDEMKDQLSAIAVNREFAAQRTSMRQKNVKAFDGAREFLQKNKILHDLRNRVGAHIDPKKLVQKSIKYMGENAISAIHHYEEGAPLHLDFATHILQGGIGANLPGGVEKLPEEMAAFFQAMKEAFGHVMVATLVLVRTFLWDSFGEAERG
jgi:hypothetical protein